MILKITKSTDPVWKKKFVDISPTPQLQKIVADMKETLSFTMGVGLAAPQVGYPYRLFIISYGDLKETFLNPKILSKSKETDWLEEGCLSIPGHRGLVERATEVEIEYTNLAGQIKRGKLTGFYARIFQHEYDHLNSTFYVQRIQKPKHLYKFEPIRIVFFGSNSFSANILLSLIGQTFIGDYIILLVVTSPDKPSGRGKRVNKNQIKEITQKFGIETITPEKISRKNNDKFELINQDLYQKIKKANPDVLVLASYGKIIPKEILDLPKLAPINVHPSLLPKYRGPSPIQTAILNGDKFTGITIMRMNEKMDEGDIFIKGRYNIKPNETTESLTKALSELAKDLLHHTIYYLALKKIKPKPQDHSKATYTKIIRKEDGKIDWKNPPKNLERMIRAYYPWPGVWTEYNGKILKILPEKTVQLEGKNPVSLKVFKQGHKDFTLEW